LLAFFGIRENPLEEPDESFEHLVIPNIIRAIDLIQEKGTYYMILEYAEKGDLKNLMKKEPEIFNESLAIKILQEITLALQECKKINIFHPEFKPPNILITRDYHVKLSDFCIRVKYGSKGEIVTIN
jgi:serine/threonine protein kinase